MIIDRKQCSQTHGLTVISDGQLIPDYIISLYHYIMHESTIAAALNGLQLHYRFNFELFRKKFIQPEMTMESAHF